MVYVTSSAKYSCGVDLHSDKLTASIVDRSGRRITRRTMPNDRNEFLKLVKPYKQSIAVGLEATFNWYWLVDFCKTRNIVG